MGSIPSKTAALIGFARKSGKILCGDWAVKSAMKKNTVELMIISLDLTAKKRYYWEKWCTDKNVPLIISGAGEEYAKILGASARNVLAITDKQMAESIRKSFDQ